MIAKRRRPGTTTRKSSTRLPARSAAWDDKPVTLPPGRARLGTSLEPSGSFAAANTIGIADVACFAASTAPPTVTITSTLSRTNSAAISSKRSGCPSAQRYSIATVRPSIQPSSRSRCANAATHWLQAEAVPGPRKPIVGSLPAGCACAPSGQSAVAPAMSVMKSRRLMGFSQGQDYGLTIAGLEWVGAVHRSKSPPPMSAMDHKRHSQLERGGGACPLSLQ